MSSLPSGPSYDPLPAHQEGGVRPALPRGGVGPQRGDLLPPHPHREDVQGLPGEDGGEDQVLEEALVRLRPPQEDLLLLCR